ncbi:MAG: sigma-70 family RNA polymerase sigma factor [Prevotella sp.]|nr:sigma-70 family RNA polymerase sigma factor [Prevotella sp.]
MIDKREFETIFRHHYDGMFRLARKMLGDDAESKDVVSDVFAHLLDSGKDLRADTLQSYLLTSVRNRCINLLVKKQRTQAVVVDLNTENTDRELLDDMYHYIDGQLPPLSQQVLRLRYQQGLKYREIAEALQVSEVTVHNHLSQSLKQLKDHFKSLGYGIK